MPNFLIITEGGFDTHILGSIFDCFNFNVQKGRRNQKFETIEYEKDDTNIFLVPGKHTQVTKLIEEGNRLYSVDSAEIANSFGLGNMQPLVFFTYDIDENKLGEIEKIAKEYESPEDGGLLILSNPTIESILDTKLEDIKLNIPDDYKVEIAGQTGVYKSEKDFIKYFQRNVKTLLLHHIDENIKSTGINNIVDHCEYYYNNIPNLRSELIDEKHKYEYKDLFNLVYVILLYVFKLQYKNDNDKLLREIIEKL